MSARRNPDGDYPLYHQFLVQAKCVVKRRIAKPGIAVERPALPYLIVRYSASPTRTGWRGP